MIWRFGLAVLATFSMAGAAVAQPAAPGAAAPSARSLELSHRLLVDMQLTRQLEVSMKSLLPAMLQQQEKAFPGFKPEWQGPLTDATIAAMDDILPGYLKDAETLYAQTFTEDELTKAVAFYESPAGRAMIDKAPSLAPGLTKAMISRMDGMNADVHTRFCAKVNVCGDQSAAPKPNGT